jgi:hypothetical protein
MTTNEARFLPPSGGNKHYFYVKGKKGLSHSGSFVDNRARWVKFCHEEMIKGKPKAAQSFGAFVETTKFR